MDNKTYEFDWEAYLEKFPVLQGVEAAEILKEDEKKYVFVCFWSV
ncbi:hypothetical protein ELI_2484 [Eubacterium callanderi]|uniref:Uncharacterized protein n=1 Tax=Eubacterium callanderi TaxID=53442 RepID=E3GNX6_9FIRM|nr:hypothetical protein [Eubacterium callanderi]ADO37466.1 hypothetical protein ELI_2484 [Eubacterium callanderi]